MSITRSTVIVHDEIVREKLLMAAPRILANNRFLVVSMLEMAKPIVQQNTPLGPGHFGYHGRDTLRIGLTQTLKQTRGRLIGAVQLYWREYGTLARFRGPKKTAAQSLKQAVGMMTGAMTGGEPAYQTAHKAIGATRRFISFYYGGMANWWRL